MQVHDELVLEVLESELELVKTKLPKIMARVADGMLWACRWWQKWVCKHRFLNGIIAC